MKRITKLISLALLAAVSFSCKDPLNEGNLDNYINVDPTSIEATHEEKIVEITVDANCEWTLKKTNEDGSAADWFQVDKTKGNGSTTFNVKVLANPTAETRSGSIDLVAENATAFITISQTLNPNPGQTEPDINIDPVQKPLYSMPVYQMIGEGLTIEGNKITFEEGLVIEKKGAAGNLAVEETDTFLPCIKGSNFSAGDSWIYKIPMRKETSGSLIFSYGSRGENITAKDSYQWSSDNGATWNNVDSFVTAVSHESLKSVYFTIPADKKVAEEGELWIKVAQTESTVYIQNGITLEYTDVEMTTLPAQDETQIVISEGFDGTKDAHGAMINVPGFMKGMTSGKTVSGTDTGLLTVDNAAISFVHASARPGFAQIGYCDPTSEEGGYNGEMRIDVGARLEEMGIANTSLKVSFKAAGLTTVYDKPGDAKIVIKSGDEVVAGVEKLSYDSWSKYTLRVNEADQNTVLVITSEVPAAEKADLTFFIDDVLIEIAEARTVLKFQFEFDVVDQNDLSPLPAGWPTDNSKIAEPDPFICSYTLDGTTYNFGLYDDANEDSNSKDSGIFLRSASKNKKRILGMFCGTYMALPAIQGMKLVKVEYTTIADHNNKRYGGIASKINDIEKNDCTYLEGGEHKLIGQNVTDDKSFTLKNTEIGATYYLTSVGTSWTGYSSLTLIYE